MKEETIPEVFLVFVSSIQLLFLGGSILYVAGMIRDAIMIREILFWTTLMMMFILYSSRPLVMIWESIEELFYKIKSKREKGGEKNERRRIRN